MTLEALASQFETFLEEAHRLKKSYAESITLLVGLETEFITEADLENLEECLRRYEGRIEYLVGSVHHVNGIPIDFDAGTFQNSLSSFGLETTEGADADHHRMGAFLCAYFDAQYQILTRFRPEILGHLDLCRLYNPSLRFKDYPLVFELNAAALRKGWDAAYPGDDVVAVSTDD